MGKTFWFTELGEVGCTNGSWWVIRASSGLQQKVACDSVVNAVRRLCPSQISLSVVEVSPVSCDELLDRAFDELSASEWCSLLEYETALTSSELIAA